MVKPAKVNVTNSLGIELGYQRTAKPSISIPVGNTVFEQTLKEDGIPYFAFSHAMKLDVTKEQGRYHNKSTSPHFVLETKESLCSALGLELKAGYSQESAIGIGGEVNLKASALVDTWESELSFNLDNALQRPITEQDPVIKPLEVDKYKSIETRGANFDVGAEALLTYGGQWGKIGVGAEGGYRWTGALATMRQSHATIDANKEGVYVTPKVATDIVLQNFSRCSGGSCRQVASLNLTAEATIYGGNLGLRYTF